MFFTLVSWQSKICKNCHFYLVRSIFKRVILSHYMIQFLYQRLHLTRNLCNWAKRWKALIFSLHQNPDSPKIPKCVNTFALSRHAKSSLTATTGFLSYSNIGIKKSLLLLNISPNNHLYRSLTSDSPKKSRNSFQYRVFSFFKAGLPLNYQPDVFLQSCNLMLPTWVGW